LESKKQRDAALETNLLTGLNQVQINIKRMMEKRDKGHVDTGQLQDAINTLVREGRRVDDCERILLSLKYEQMPYRFEQILETHAQTYEWIFREKYPPSSPSNASITISDIDTRYDSSRSTGRRNNFMTWLTSGSGVFWVSGKPGSGKSTLMKFVCDHPRTKSALSIWAGQSTLVTASFFFWNGGTAMQKSQLGLWRSLCFEILRKCPSLIPEVCSERMPKTSAPAVEPGDWTLTELKQVIERLRSHNLEIEGRSLRFCFFIDGLDEYDGFEEEIISTVRDLVDSSNIKLCVSSRQWNAFEEAFSSQSLVLQDFTKADIQSFVEDELGQHPRFISMRDEDPEYLTLLDEVVEKADSVFLWVFLAVRQLRRSLTNGDGLSLLRERLRQMPPKLNDYFRHMFDSLEAFYNKQTAQTFLMRIHAPVPPPLISYCVLDPENERVRKFFDGISTDQRSFSQLQDDLRKHINSRCRDLLEVTTVSGYPTVSYLHRTVRDFLLKNRDIVNLLVDRAGGTFDLESTLLTASTLPLRCIRHLGVEPWQHAPTLLNTVLYHAHTLEQERQVVSWDIVNGVERLLNERSIPAITTFIQQTSLDDMQSWFLAHVLQHGLDRYLDLRLIRQPHLVTSRIIGSLRSVHLRDESWSRLETTVKPSVIEVLLGNGYAGSDQTTPVPDSSTTLWVPFLQRMYSLRNFLTPNLTVNCISIVEKLVKAGAETDFVPIDECGKMAAVPEQKVISEIFGEYEAARLLQLRIESRKAASRQGWIGWLWK
jgi:hypothetical protein